MHGGPGFTLSLVRFSCDLSGWFSLVSERGGRQAAEDRVEPSVVEVSRPFFDPGVGVGHRQDPGGVQAFLAQSAVERLDMRVVAGFSGPRDVQFDLVERGPLLDQTPGELGAVVDANALRLASEPGEAVERFDDLTGAKFVLAAVESASRVWTTVAQRHS